MVIKSFEGRENKDSFDYNDLNNQLYSFIQQNKETKNNKLSIKQIFFYFFVYGSLFFVLFSEMSSSFLYTSFIFGIFLISFLLAIISFRYHNIENLFLNLVIIFTSIFLFITPSYLVFLASFFSFIIFLAIILFRKYEYKSFWLGVTLIFLFFITVLSKLNILFDPSSYLFAKKIAKETQRNTRDAFATQEKNLFFLMQGIKSSLYEAFLPLVNPEEYKKRMDQVIGEEVEKMENLGMVLTKEESSIPLDDIKTLPIYLYVSYSFYLNRELKQVLDNLNLDKELNKNLKLKISFKCGLEGGECFFKEGKNDFKNLTYSWNVSYLMFENPSENLLKSFNLILEVIPYKEYENLNLETEYNYFQYGEGSIDLYNLSVYFIQLKSLLNTGFNLKKFGNSVIGYLSLNDFSFRIKDNSENKINKIDKLILCFNKIKNGSDYIGLVKSISSFKYGSWSEKNLNNYLQCFVFNDSNNLLNFNNKTFDFINLPLQIVFSNKVKNYPNNILYFFLLVIFNTTKRTTFYLNLDNEIFRDFILSNYIRELGGICESNKTLCENGEKLYSFLSSKANWNIINKSAFIYLNTLITRKMSELKRIFKDVKGIGNNENDIRMFILSQVYIESRFDPKVINDNGDSRDRGLFQINDKFHPDCDEKCAFNIENAFNYYLKIYKEEIIPFLKKNNCLNIENLIRSYNGGPCCWKEKKCEKSELQYEKTADYFAKWEENIKEISNWEG